MPKICYVPKDFNDAHMLTINRTNEIIDAYAAQGFDLTLRQVYYQFVSRGWLPNNERAYKNLGTVVSDARLAGLIDWNAINDRTRFIRGLNHWSDPADIVNGAARQFRIDKWARQPNHVEVWVEKDALVGVLEGVCNELDVTYFSCRGYTSQSEMWGAARRLGAYKRIGKDNYVIHLGDHDPSGRDMTRDIDDRLALFMGGCTVNRIALNWEQIEEYGPPPNPAKLTDSRAQGYIAAFGYESWELDALEPTVIADLIRSTVLRLRDAALWEEAIEEEEAHKAGLQTVARNWDEVLEHVRSL